MSKVAWSGYDNAYVKTMIKGAMKSLKLLATLTFDVGLLYWVNGLEKHLKKRMAEVDKDKDIVKSFGF